MAGSRVEAIELGPGVLPKDVVDMVIVGDRVAENSGIDPRADAGGICRYELVSEGGGPVSEPT